MSLFHWPAGQHQTAPSATGGRGGRGQCNLAQQVGVAHRKIFAAIYQHLNLYISEEKWKSETGCVHDYKAFCMLVSQISESVAVVTTRKLAANRISEAGRPKKGNSR